MKTYNILSIDEFKKNIGNNSRLLGIDPGKKNIGLAICDENKAVATPFKTLIKNKFESLLREIDKIIQENEIKGIVIGSVPIATLNVKSIISLMLNSIPIITTPFS